MKKPQKSPRSNRGNLFKAYGKHLSWERFSEALGRKQRGAGIYALYKGTKLYYVGLSSISIRTRVRRHALHDRHAGKWNNFSFFQCRKKKYVKDIETILLMIYGKPQGNRVSGKLPKKHRTK